MHQHTIVFIAKNRGPDITQWALGNPAWRLNRRGLAAYILDFDGKAGDGGSTEALFSNTTAPAPFVESMKATSAKSHPIFQAIMQATQAKLVKLTKRNTVRWQ